MNDITALMATMKAAAENATPGEWWSDVVETDGEYGDGEDRHSGYHSYAVYVGSESLLDMTNSTAACIHEEWDHDYHMAWDETAKRNAEFIAVASPANVLALVEALEKAQQDSDGVTGRREYKCHICAGPIAKGEVHRSAKWKFDGELMPYRCCNACCVAMVASVNGDYEENDPIEARYALGHERKELTA